MKKVITNWRIITLVLLLIFALFQIQYSPFNSGVVVQSVAPNSPAYEAGIISPANNVYLPDYEKIITVNGIDILNQDDYYTAIQNASELSIITDQDSYFFSLEQNESIGIRISDAHTANIRTGLDLQGGTRILLEPENQVSQDDMDLIRDSVEKRLNAFGLADIQVRVIYGNVIDPTSYIMVEVAGADATSIIPLITQQGKFEAKIANETIFTGTQVAVSQAQMGSISGVDPSSCGMIEQGLWSCRHTFPISLSAEAAANHAAATRNLDIVNQGTDRYLSEKLELYLDDILIDDLFIGADLKGSSTTRISISGSGSGPTREAAIENSLAEMTNLQTILRSGNLPSKLEVVKVDTVSATLGHAFINNAMLVGIIAIFAIILIISIRYKNLILSIPIVFISLTEVVLLFGFAAWTGWNIDLAAIAGIIIIIGTSIDHQVIITDETLSRKVNLSWKGKLKKALRIIITAYFTSVVAMIPLMAAGAGLLRGFALTTIVGITIGVLITRPAYAIIIEYMSEKFKSLRK